MSCNWFVIFHTPYCWLLHLDLEENKKARVFSCLMTQRSMGLEASVIGIKSWGCSPLSQGRAFHHLEASFWAAGSLKATTCHSPKCWIMVIAVAFLHNACFPEVPPTGSYLLPLVGVVGAKPEHLYQDPPEGVVYWVWLFLGPWSASQLGSTSRWFSWDFRLGLPV